MYSLFIYDSQKYVPFAADLINNEFSSILNKRLTNNVIKTVQTLSTSQCTTWCSMTDGCLAVNVIGNHDIICELTTGLSNEDEMQDDDSSQLLVLSRNYIYGYSL